MKKWTVIVTVFLCAGAAWAGPAAIGDPVEDVTFKDIRFLPRTLEDFGEREAIVLVFHEADDAEAIAVLDALAEAHAGRSVTVGGLDLTPERNIVELAADTLAAGASYTVLKNYDNAAAKALGIDSLPAAVVLDGDRVLRYRGPVAGAADALDAVLSGGETAAPERAIDGSPLPDWSVPEPETVPTFADDIAPIINKHCYECHRKGQSAPFSLRTFKQVSHRGDMIAEVVREGRMPPWYASEAHGEFMNDRSMTDEEILTIRQWVAAGKPSGDLDNAPEPPEFEDSEWQIGEPDLILEVPEVFETPATGYIPYEYVGLPYVFPEETWVQGIEILPSNPAVVHHANLAFNNPEEGGYEEQFNFLTGYVPGGAPVDIPGPIAMKIPKGAGLFLQIHYVTTGKKEKNRMRVGIRYAEGTILKKVHYKRLRPETIDIAPYDPRYPMQSEWEFDRNAIALALFSHMHLRGRDMSFFAQYPDGRNETLLVIPNYNFDWQLAYQYVPGSKLFPRGTTLKTRSHYDNSAFNPYNPDPSKTVEYGDQTYHEMNDAYVFYLDQDEMLNLAVDGETGIVKPRQG